MEDRVLQGLHYSSATAITTSLATWLNGGTIISAGSEPRDPLLTLKALATEHATVFVAPLELYNLIAAHPALAKHSFPQLRVAVVVAPAGQAPSAAEIERLKSVFKTDNLLLASTVGEAGIAFVRPLLSTDLSELGSAIHGAAARVDSSSGELSVRTAQAQGRRVLSGVSDEWTPAYIKASSHGDRFVLDP
jgi:acyl-CoA synthetase (AMP-forming)/AMP-acid ligase II